MAAYYIMTNYGPMSIQGLKRISDDKINEILKDAPKDMDICIVSSGLYSDELAQIAEKNSLYEQIEKLKNSNSKKESTYNEITYLQDQLEKIISILISDCTKFLVFIIIDFL